MSPVRIDTPEDFPVVFAATFNRRALEALVLNYATNAVLDCGGPNIFRGRAAIVGPIANFLSSGLPITVTPRKHAVTGDTAIVVFDWRIVGVASNGEPVALGGTAIDVLRRERDGAWRQLLDLPFGIATAPG